MSCNAKIETKTLRNVVSVPIQSVTARNNMETSQKQQSGNEDKSNNSKKKTFNSDKLKEIVFLTDKGKAKSVDVETGISDDNYIQIVKGLKAGEEVVTGPYRAISRELQNGSNIRVDNKTRTYGGANQ